MSDQEKHATAGLEFFRSAILDPALEVQSFFDFEDSNTVSDFGAVEAAHWAWLGVQIGYFDGKDAQELISSSEGVFKAWLNLRNREIISSDDDWAKIIRQAESGQLSLNKELFSGPVNMAPRIRKLLHITFQNVLLLTAENIFEHDSLYFLDSIGWSDHREWDARRVGSVRRLLGSVQDIGFGFANVLNYWEAMDSSSRSAEDRDAGRDKSAFVFEHGWDIDTSFSKGLAVEASVPNFIQDVRAVLSRRFNLGQVDIVGRYFVLAGEFANRARDDSPEWLDALLKVFERLILLITFAGGGASTIDHKRLLWNAFTKGTEIPEENIDTLLEDEIRPLEDRKREPPKEFT